AGRPARVGRRLSDRNAVHGDDLNTTVSGLRGSLAAVAVFEPDDVVEVGGRDLDDLRVVDRRDPVDRPRTESERRAWADDLVLEDGVAGGAELELGPALLNEPRLVLDVVELQAERLAGLHEQQLADVVVGLGPDQLVTPGLLDLARIERPVVETLDVRRVE